ncbi:hypothetical protein SB658_25855, partial [Bacillus sp. SIMBA_008]|uniref:hypothetical protein n=1 Tax=Bacillus sp. SIMBA_008 TaxID=3085757 RepID=UPI0039780A68
EDPEHIIEHGMLRGGVGYGDLGGHTFDRAAKGAKCASSATDIGHNAGLSGYRKAYRSLISRERLTYPVKSR